MNQVSLIGRITRDPEVRYGAQSQTAVARFSIAIDRGKDKDGNDKGADYPGILCFGKTAELVERYLGKGRLVGITGKIQTGSYDKDGKKVYTTEVLADHIEFLDRAESKGEGGATPKPAPEKPETSENGFEALDDDDIPF